METREAYSLEMEFLEVLQIQVVPVMLWDTPEDLVDSNVDLVDSWSEGCPLTLDCLDVD